MEIKSNTVVVDRIEEGFAVIELSEENFLEIPLEFLPDNIKEGDVLSISIKKVP